MARIYVNRLQRLEARLALPEAPSLPPVAYVEDWGTPSARIVCYARPQPPGAPIDYRRAFDDDALDWLEEPIPCPQTLTD